ncbi:hypothetical protein [Teredinibacter haidensis]|uniref:hypothetical protein n=1 Tax=Teredinibacter haidensis TaxID=2731755 RepID=UPI00094906FA|nr:hypothetical protein [Teredinibacter haidensis]
MNLKVVFFQIPTILLSLAVVACGGGNATPVEPGSNNSVPSPDPAPGSAEGAFRLSHSTLAYTARDSDIIYFQQDIIGTLNQPDGDVYIFVDVSGTDLIVDAEAILSEVDYSGTLTLTTQSSDLLPGVGIYTGSFTVSACKDAACTTQYSGSPKTVDVIYSVIPSENEDASCSMQPGLVFGECVATEWLGVLGWEMLKDGTYTNFLYTDNNSDYLVNWDVIDTEEEGYGRVIDVSFNNDDANGSLSFGAPYSEDGYNVNMSGYNNGTIEFDIRMLDWGDATDLFAHVSCHYPCISENISLGTLAIGEWTHISLSVSEMISTGLDTSVVTEALSLEPSWDAMNGLRYQLDNVRWVKGDGDPIEELGEQVQEILLGEQAVSYDFWGGAPSMNDFYTEAGVLTFNPGWSTVRDKIAIRYDLNPLLDLTNGSVQVEMYIPENYTGNEVEAQLFVMDYGYRYAAPVAINLAAMEVGGWTTLSLAGLSDEDFDYKEDGFDKTLIQVVGVQLYVTGEAVPAGSDSLQFRNFRIDKGATP